MSSKDIIRRNKTDIIAILSGDWILILNKAHEEELITDREYINLKDINRETAERHVVELVDKIMNKDDEDICKKFLNLLQTDEGIKGAFPKLKKLPLGDNRPLSQPVQASSSHNDLQPPEWKSENEMEKLPLGDNCPSTHPVQASSFHSEVQPPAYRMKNVTKGERAFAVRTPQLWNSLPQHHGQANTGFYEPRTLTTNVVFMNRDNITNGSMRSTINQYADVKPVKKAMKRKSSTKTENSVPKKAATMKNAVINAAKKTPKKAAANKPANKMAAAKKRPPKETAAKKPAVKKPAAKKPTTKKPTARKPANKKPAAKKPTTKKPAAKKPTTKKPTAKKPANKKPAAKKPAAKKPAAKKAKK